VPLGDVANLREEASPEIVQRENGQRRLVVQSNVRGRDLGSFVAEAQQRITAAMPLPAGYYLRWGGQFEHQERAMRRLMLITPAALIAILLICYISFGSFSQATLVMMLAPFATVGGVAALWLRGMNLNVSAAIGFIAVFGIATIDGLVLVSAINKRLEEGHGLNSARLDAAVTRLRPVLMTSIVAALGLLPMAAATSTGAEVQRPLATVVIGGVISSTLLTLLLVPTFFPWFRGRRWKKLDRAE
jgi:cobalt-zinc-cadmium resistance protein CzcA